MKELFKYNIEDFKILSVDYISESAISPFSKVIINTNKKVSKNINPLGGRAEIVIKNLPDLGMVVFKNYFRGGFISFFNKRHYLRCRQGIRPLNEILFLLEMKNLGIPVPDPIAAYYKGRYLYRGGIVMKYINSPYTLAEYSIKNEKKAKEIFYEKFYPVYEKIIKNNIYHPDLHPGNVVVSNEEDIFIIDFDKAEYFDGLPFYLREKTESRWNRAVSKYNLPSFLAIHPEKQH